MRILKRSSRGGLVQALLALAVLPAPAGVAAAGACSARSGASVPVVVELYTSQGCDSCPPADRWLGSLKGRADVIPLAFHVDYWDSRDWKDRFAQAKFTRRQNAALRASGARFAYTPQVVVDGVDQPGWSRLPAEALQPGRPSTVDMALTLDAAGVELALTPRAGAPADLVGYVAVVDDGMRTRIDGGENHGVTLEQDSVVREWLPWRTSGTQPQTLRFTSRTTPEPGATRHWAAVATDGPYGKPLQAVTLACAP